MSSKYTLKEAVLKAILEQRDNKKPSIPDFCGPDVFQYNVTDGQAFIDGLKSFEKYEVGYDEQIGMIRDLTKRGIIEADWAIKNDNSEDKFEYRLANNADWAQDVFDFDQMWGDVNMDNCYIHMTFKDARAIYDKYLKRYSAQLSINEWPRLVVTCDGMKYCFSSLDEKKRPYKVISYALKPENINREIFKEELNKMLKNESECKKLSIGKEEAIGSRVFERNHVIREVLSPFIELAPDYICAHDKVWLTNEQLEIIKEHCRFSRGA